MAREVRKHIPVAPVTLNGSWKGGFSFVGTIKQVLIQPHSPDTIYNVGIKDESGMLIFVRYDIAGSLVTEDLDIILFPGEKNIIIEDSSKDELFDVKIIYQL